MSTSSTAGNPRPALDVPSFANVPYFIRHGAAKYSGTVSPSKASGLQGRHHSAPQDSRSTRASALSVSAAVCNALPAKVQKVASNVSTLQSKSKISDSLRLLGFHICSELAQHAYHLDVAHLGGEMPDLHLDQVASAPDESLSSFHALNGSGSLRQVQRGVLCEAMPCINVGLVLYQHPHDLRMARNGSCMDRLHASGPLRRSVLVFLCLSVSFLTS